MTLPAPRAQRRLVARYAVRERPQLLEARALGQLGCALGAEVDQHAARVAEPTEQRELARIEPTARRALHDRMIAGKKRNAGLPAAPGQELRRSRAHEVTRRRVRKRVGKPRSGLARFGAAVDVWAGKEVGGVAVEVHGLTVRFQLAERPSFYQRA